MHKKRLIITILFFIGIYIFFPTWTPTIQGFENSITYLGQVMINGSKQEVMIRGNNRENPVIVFVHGGPACSDIIYITKYQKLLEKDFTVVHYDQRGTGKSYHIFEDNSDITIDLLVQDLLALTDYIIDTLPTDKVILMGHSFGTGIAIRAAKAAPEKYLAYIGIGQQSSPKEMQQVQLAFCMEQATISENFEDVHELTILKEETGSESLKFPIDYVRKYGGAARKIKEGKDVMLGLLMQPEYNLFDGIGYYFGIQKTGKRLWKEFLTRNLEEEVSGLSIPCYFVSGVYDYLTPMASAKKYFDGMQAPYKEFVIFEEAAHYPHLEEPKLFYEWLLKSYREVIEKGSKVTLETSSRTR